MTKEEITQQIIRELSFIYDENISEQTTFADLEMDDTDMAELLADMEQRFGVKLDCEPATVEELTAEVWRAKNENVIPVQRSWYD